MRKGGSWLTERRGGKGGGVLEGGGRAGAAAALDPAARRQRLQSFLHSMKGRTAVSTRVAKVQQQVQMRWGSGPTSSMLCAKLGPLLQRTDVGERQSMLSCAKRLTRS